MMLSDMGDKFCSNCGKPLLQKDNFCPGLCCPGCGKSSERATPSEPKTPGTNHVLETNRAKGKKI
ncbi:MAG: hypothetical protein ACXWEP_04875 [Halobacteriota archaeon]